MIVTIENLIEAISIHAQNISTKNIATVFGYDVSLAEKALMDSNHALYRALADFIAEVKR